MASKRIMKELKDLEKDPPTSCSAGSFISEMDTSKGICVLGSFIRRPPLPRGGVNANFRTYEELQVELERNKEELEKAKEERTRECEEDEAFMRELMASFKALSEQVCQETGVTPQNPLPNINNGYFCGST